MLHVQVAAARLMLQSPPGEPPGGGSAIGPTGPEAPADVQSLVTKSLNFGLFLVLAVCFAGALYGLGSMWYAKKKQNFGGVNEGQATLGWALGAAAGTTVLRGLFAFLGV
jgi:hypothetical protein